MSGYLLGTDALALIRRVCKDYLAEAKNSVTGRTRGIIGQRNRQAYLLEDLFAAEDTLADPSTARARLLRKNAAGNLELTNTEVTVYNRFQNISIDADTYIKVEWIDGEWQPYGADCAPDSQSISSAGSDPAIASDPSLFPPGPGGGL
jgi:hypothetical protein